MPGNRLGVKAIGRGQARFTIVAAAVLCLAANAGQGGEAPKLPIAVKLPQPGAARLCVFDEQGNVVQQLCTEELPAGEHTVWCAKPALSAARPPAQSGQGESSSPPGAAGSGRYRWAGVVGPRITPRRALAFSPIWYPPREGGGPWLGSGLVRSIACVGKSVWLCAYSESGDCLIEANGQMRRLWGARRVLQLWPAYLAADGQRLFFLAFAEQTQSVAIAEIDHQSKRARLLVLDSAAAADVAAISGFAVSDGLALVALRERSLVLVYDLRRGEKARWYKPECSLAEAAGPSCGSEPVRRIALPQPRALCALPTGEVACLSGVRVVAIDPRCGRVRPLLSGKLENPISLAADARGAIFIGEGEPRHQVLCLSAKGDVVRTYGKPGARKPGPFDNDELEEPAALAVDWQGRLWVAEHCPAAPRLSLWESTRRCLGAVVVPQQSCGGPSVDPADATRIFYGGLELRRRGEGRAVELVRLIFRPDDRSYTTFGAAPGRAFRREGRLFFASAQGWGKTGLSVVWADSGYGARPVAAVGKIPQQLLARIARIPEDPHFGEKVKQRVDETINFNWGNNPPDPDVQRDHFAARWSGVLRAPAAGTYTFITTSDDGVRLAIDGRVIINNWTTHGATEDRGTIELEQGTHSILLEYFEAGGHAQIKLEWEGPGIAREVIPADALAVSDAPGAARGLAATFYHEWHPPQPGLLFAWTDENGDGRVQMYEVATGNITYAGDPWERLGAAWQCLPNERFDLAFTTATPASAALAFCKARDFTLLGYPIFELPNRFLRLPQFSRAATAVMVTARGEAIAVFEKVVSLAPSGKIGWLCDTAPFCYGFPAFAEKPTAQRGSAPLVLILGSGATTADHEEIICLVSTTGLVTLITADGVVVDQFSLSDVLGERWRANSDAAYFMCNGAFQEAYDGTGHIRHYIVLGHPFCVVFEVSGLNELRRLSGGPVGASP